MEERGVRTGRSVVHSSVKANDGTRKFLLQVSLHQDNSSTFPSLPTCPALCR